MLPPQKFPFSFFFLRVGVSFTDVVLADICKSHFVVAVFLPICKAKFRRYYCCVATEQTGLSQAPVLSRREDSSSSVLLLLVEVLRDIACESLSG